MKNIISMHVLHKQQKDMFLRIDYLAINHFLSVFTFLEVKVH